MNFRTLWHIVTNVSAIGNGLVFIYHPSIVPAFWSITSLILSLAIYLEDAINQRQTVNINLALKSHQIMVVDETGRVIKVSTSLSDAAQEKANA